MDIPRVAAQLAPELAARGLDTGRVLATDADVLFAGDWEYPPARPLDTYASGAEMLSARDVRGGPNVHRRSSDQIEPQRGRPVASLRCGLIAPSLRMRNHRMRTCADGRALLERERDGRGVARSPPVRKTRQVRGLLARVRARRMTPVAPLEC